MNVEIIPRSQTTPGTRGPHKSPERVAIEAALQQLTPKRAMKVVYEEGEDLTRITHQVINARRATGTHEKTRQWRDANHHAIYVAYKDA